MASAVERSKRSNGWASAMILLHLSLDAGEVIFLDGRCRVDVVIEAVLDGRPERQLHAGEQPHDGPRHDVSAAVPQNIECFAILVGENLKRHFGLAGRQLNVQIDDDTVDLGRHRRLRQSLADALGHLARPGSFRHLLLRTVGKSQSEHDPFSRNASH